MDNSPSCGASSQPCVRSISKCRLWSKKEEDVLILALKEIIHDGWKCENGFRVGYVNMLEKIMRRHFPTTDLCADPHIGNKLHVWKKNHGSIQCMLSRFGFSWDDKQHMVVFQDESIWDEYVKTDNHAKGMKNKSYPLYSLWCEVFGKDRATGEFAEDLQGAAADKTIDVEEERADDNMSCEPLESDPNDVTSSMHQSGKSAGKTRKRKSRGFEDEAGLQLVKMMGTFCEQTNNNLQMIVGRIGYEFELRKKRQMLFEMIGSLGVLNVDQQICAAKILAKNSEDLEVFFSLPKEAQGWMVVMMVSGMI